MRILFPTISPSPGPGTMAAPAGPAPVDDADGGISEGRDGSCRARLGELAMAGRDPEVLRYVCRLADLPQALR